MIEQKFLGAIRALKAQDPATIRKHLPSVRRAYEQTVKELLDRDLSREINRDALHLVELEMRQLESQANEFESDKLKLERG